MIDLHIHTSYSDGNQTVSKACKTAREKGLDFIAITDHFTHNTSKSRIINHLMPSKIPGYLNEIEITRTNLDFPVLKGIEIDAESDFTSVKNIKLEHFDIVLIEYISSIKVLKKYANYSANYFNRSDYKRPIITLAHPNIHLNLSINSLKTEFIPILMKNDIYFECNTHYPYYFEKSTERMKILISSGVRFTFGSDAHHCDRIGDVKKLYNFLEGLNGSKNIIKLKKLSQYIQK